MGVRLSLLSFCTGGATHFGSRLFWVNIETRFSSLPVVPFQGCIGNEVMDSHLIKSLISGIMIRMQRQ